MKQRSALSASGHKFRTENISKRAKRIVISPIKEMSILSDNFKEETGKDIISFGQGIPYFDTPSFIKKGIIKSLKEIDTAKYTLEPGITKLRELIAKTLEKEKGIKKIEPKREIMVSSGCQEAMACAIATIIDEGDEVVLSTPCFASHIEQVLQFGGVPVFSPLDEKKRWNLNIKEIEKKITKKTKAIILSNPSNPTGSVLSKKETEGLAKIVKKYDLILITDETYDFLVYDNIKHFSPASISSIRDRVILCGSFSKKYAMTGYRIGYVFSEKGIIDHMLKFHDSFSICAPAISQKAAIYALLSSQNSVLEFKKELAKNRDLMCSELDKLKFLFEHQKPKGAYYIFAKYKISKINSFDFAIKLLKEANVVVIPGAAFGPSGEGYVRFSFACSKKEIKEGFKRLNEWRKKQMVDDRENCK